MAKLINWVQSAVINWPFVIICRFIYYCSCTQYINNRKQFAKFQIINISMYIWGIIIKYSKEMQSKSILVREIEFSFIENCSANRIEITFRTWNWWVTQGNSPHLVCSLQKFLPGRFSSPFPYSKCNSIRVGTKTVAYSQAWRIYRTLCVCVCTGVSAAVLPYFLKPLQVRLSFISHTHNIIIIICFALTVAMKLRCV